MQLHGDSILIYNSETWMLTERLKNKLQAFEMGCIRKILGVSKISHIRNTDINNQLNIQHDIVDRIQNRHLTYFGHELECNFPDGHTEPYMVVFMETDTENDRGNAGRLPDDGPLTHTSNTRG